MGYRIFAALLLLLPIVGTAQNTDTLQQVDVKDKRDGNFGHMRQVEGMKITAGKKSEVINVEQLTVNKATNNTRQVYAKVAGLNIFENDGSGLQLSIGGRGLDPNRTSNFNVRQNGYDISADALGYPESYYTPPAEALRKIEIIKGAASLQYGTQFGGLLNFEMKQAGGSKPVGIESRQTAGSFGFLGTYNSIYGTKDKVSYFAYVQYKQGNGWRANSAFQSVNAYADVRYQLNDKNSIGLQYTLLKYLAQQPGGLDDKMFEEDPRQSNRSRNWFAVSWNLLEFEWKNDLSQNTRIETKAYGLMATRDAIGFRPNRTAQPDNGGVRDLLKGSFNTLALESRLLQRYNIGGRRQVLLTGIRVYKGHSTNQQGNVDNGSSADFSFANEATDLLSDYQYPNLNIAAFAEQIFYISDKWSVTPGVRVEHIKTQASGLYHNQQVDLRGVVYSDIVVNESLSLPRNFIIGAVGTSYIFSDKAELYGNFSQNYRSVTFSDIRVTNPSFEIDPNIADEKGWSADAGLRGSIQKKFRYDGGVFYMYYGNRIGEYLAKTANSQVKRRRANIGVAQIYGLETFMELDVLKLWKTVPDDLGITIYSNLALTSASYTRATSDIKGNRVEYVPAVNWKAGLQASYRQWKLTAQYSYLSNQYADATNAEKSSYSAVNGLIPAYQVIDISAGWSRKWLSIDATVNNVTNSAYFTRRATGYPGPGILPGDGRGLYVTAGIKF